MSLGVSERPAPRVCPVCGGTEFVAMFRRRRGELRRAPGRYRITESSRLLVSAVERCVGCGLGMLPSGFLRAEDYVAGADERFAALAPVRIRNAERLLRLLPPPAAGARLVDIGSAYGFLLVAARGLGYVPTGIEPSRDAAQYARRTYGVEVLNTPVQNAGLAPGSIDVVTMADVIEHLEDPGAVIERVRRILRPGGRLVILTPDLDSAMARLLGRRWWGLLDDHCVYFSRRTLRRFLERHGFAVERIGALGRAFPVRHWVFKLAPYSAPVERALQAVVRSVRLSEVEIPVNFGDQMACVARRVEGPER